MFKPSADVALSNQRNGFRQRVVEGSLGPRLDRTEGLLELGDTFFKGIEVRGVSRDMPDPGAGRLNQLARLGRVVKLDGVEQDEVARARAGARRTVQRSQS